LRQSHKTILLWILLILMFVSIYNLFTDSGSREEKLNATEFKQALLQLIEELAKKKDASHIYIRRDGFSLTLARSGKAEASA